MSLQEIEQTFYVCRNGCFEKCLTLAEQLEARDLAMVSKYTTGMGLCSKTGRFIYELSISGCPFQSCTVG